MARPRSGPFTRLPRRARVRLAARGIDPDASLYVWLLRLVGGDVERARRLLCAEPEHSPLAPQWEWDE